AAGPTGGSERRADAAARTRDDDVLHRGLRDLRNPPAPSPLHPSVARPDAGRRELDGAIVGIAKIDARPTTLPGDTALDGDAELGEPRFPLRDIRAADG